MKFIDWVREHWVPLLAGLIVAVFVVTFIWGGVNSINRQHTQRANEELSRVAWFEQHKCTVEGYVSGRYPHRLYRCDDGHTYIWRDIPH